MATHTLTPTEAKTLAELESIVHHQLAAWQQIGDALTQIRDQKLYREKYATFAEYLDQRWKFTASRAYQLIRSVAVVANVDNGSSLPERSARELSKLPPDRQAAAVAIAGGPTAPIEQIEGAVAHLRTRRRRQKTKQPKPLIIRGPGWKVTIERKSDQLTIESIITQLAQTEIQKTSRAA